MKRTLPTPPAHLRAETQDWWSGVVADYELEPHHLRLLTLAAESWDRCQQAREALALHGLTMEGRYGQAIARPEVAIERDHKNLFAKLLRELCLDVEPPKEVRKPRRPGTGS